MKIGLVLVMLLALAGALDAQSSAFTYQGKLQDGAAPASGTYDLQFGLFDQSGTQFGSTIQRLNVPVANGIFTVTVDFGSQFPGAGRFLEISVQHNGGGFVTLTPRQQITSAPYAINAAQLGGTAASQYILTGDARLSDARAPTAGSPNYIQNNPVGSQSANFNINGNATVVGGTIAGNGSGLTNVTAAGVFLAGSDPTCNAAAIGRMYFNSATALLKVCDGAVWNTLATSSTGGATGHNFISAVEPNTIAVIQTNTFTDITGFTVVTEDGWLLSGGAQSTFVAPVSGVYIIEYTAAAWRLNGGNGTFQIRGILNGAEATNSGSYLVTGPNDTQTIHPMSKSFMLQLNAGDNLKFQFSGSDNQWELLPLSTNFPAFSVTIIRTQ